MHTPSLADTMNLIYREDWAGVGEMMLDSARKLAGVGAAEAKARGYRRVGLTGTRWLMDGPVYSKDLIRPATAEREEINRIIMDELVCGEFKPAAVRYFQKVMEDMKREGCDAVVLGCTEIPLIMNDANSPLPTLDSTRLLARAALRRAIDKGG